MSKTVSFVARDELAEWLESRAEAEMKSISSVCQDIVAAEYLSQKQDETAKTDETQSGKDVFDRYSSQWYETTSSNHNYAVHVPRDSGLSDAGKRRYYKTRDGVEKALKRWYE